MYTGDFAAGKPAGEGSCHYANGDVYKGSWKSHGPHGFGTMTKKKMVVYLVGFGNLERSSSGHTKPKPWPISARNKQVTQKVMRPKYTRW